MLSRFLFLGLFVTFSIFAQEAVEALPTAKEWTDLLAAIGGIKGASISAIVVLVVQAIMLLVRQFVSGSYKLLIMFGLTLIGSVAGLYGQGLDWISILLHGTVLAALQNLGAQAIIQFKKG